MQSYEDNTPNKTFGGYVHDTIAVIKELKEREEKLVEALSFYSSISDYKAPYTGGMGKLYFDCGLTARAALFDLGINPTNGDATCVK